MRIEEQSFERPWTDEEFLAFLRQRTTIGRVAEYRGRIVGFMLYELHKNSTNLVKVAVWPSLRRKRIGRQMVVELALKAKNQRGVGVAAWLHDMKPNNVRTAEKFLITCDVQSGVRQRLILIA
jgi:ribosomal-protein-alanine N-acetyltransferase